MDEVLELSVDDRTGMKIYIANERSGVTTTAGYVRKTLGRCIKVRIGGYLQEVLSMLP